MNLKSKRISNFEFSSMMLVASWTLAAASTAYAQTTPAAPAGGDKAVSAAFMEADKSGDGKIDKTEAAAVPEVAAKFERIDANGDGAITLEEYSKAMKM